MFTRARLLTVCATFTAGLVLSAAACQDDTNASSTSSTSTDDDSSTSSNNGSGGNGGSSNNGTGGSGNTSSASGGGDPTCGDGAVDATISEITKGDIGPGIDVKVSGVVAMSQKFLVSKSSTGSCLWGVFLSAPDLTTTEAYSGILALSYGFQAEIPEGGDKAYCPRLGIDPAGDKLPDDVQPGDVLTLIGETDNFLLSNCAGEENGSEVPQRQLSKVCSAEKTGTAAVPAAAVISGDEVEDLSSAVKADFHDKWGGVKVAIEDVSAAPVDGESVLGDFGIITLDEGLEVGDKLYYRGYFADDVCKEGPVFTTSEESFTWNTIEGFSYLNYCTWGLQPNDKCSDFDPQSADCEAETCAPY